MFRLTREVRFAINRDHHDRPEGGSNSYAGIPPLRGPGQYFTLAATLSGELDPTVQYLVNIKLIDAVIRDRGISAVAAYALADKPACPNRLMTTLFDRLHYGWRGPTLEALRLSLTPFLSVEARREELPMTRLSQKFEFSASHRLHSAALSDAENVECYGKCNNPHGHGHNYEVQVTLAGIAESTGVLVDVPAFEKTVAETVIRKFDHKHLNAEVEEFADGRLVPSVENIAMVIYRLLKPKFAYERAKLAAVTVWETPKTWCEYSE